MHTDRNKKEMTAFLRALIVQRDASRLGFDWSDISGVLDKVAEEVGELCAAVEHKNAAHAQSELGDLLFAAVSVARFLDADPEACLEKATQRFEGRMALVKKIAADRGISLQSCPPEGLDALWEEAKRLMRQQLEKCLDNAPAVDAD